MTQATQPPAATGELAPITVRERVQALDVIRAAPAPDWGIAP